MVTTIRNIYCICGIRNLINYEPEKNKCTCGLRRITARYHRFPRSRIQCFQLRTILSLFKPPPPYRSAGRAVAPKGAFFFVGYRSGLAYPMIHSVSIFGAAGGGAGLRPAPSLPPCCSPYAFASMAGVCLPYACAYRKTAAKVAPSCLLVCVPLQRVCTLASCWRRTLGAVV